MIMDFGKNSVYVVDCCANVKQNRGYVKILAFSFAVLSNQLCEICMKIGYKRTYKFCMNTVCKSTARSVVIVHNCAYLRN